MEKALTEAEISEALERVSQLRKRMRYGVVETNPRTHKAGERVVGIRNGDKGHLSIGPIVRTYATLNGFYKNYQYRILCEDGKERSFSSVISVTSDEQESRFREAKRKYDAVYPELRKLKQFFRKMRTQVTSGKISWEEHDKQMNEALSRWEEVRRDIITNVRSTRKDG